MFRSRFFLFVVGLLIVVSSCTKATPTGDDAYYVKYATDGFKSDKYEYVVTYTDENSKIVRLSDFEGDDFERVIGPVSKGFKAEYTIKCPSVYWSCPVPLPQWLSNQGSAPLDFLPSRLWHC